LNKNSPFPGYLFIQIYGRYLLSLEEPIFLPLVLLGLEPVDYDDDDYENPLP
jgi:hypothetical protein